MSKNSMIGSNVTMDSLVAVVVAKGGTDSAVLSRFLSLVYGKDGYLTDAAKQAEQSGKVSAFVASALKEAQQSQPSMTSTAFMSSMAQPPAGQHVTPQVAAAAA